MNAANEGHQHRATRPDAPTDVETEMAQVVANCREGAILTSIPGIGPQAAATLIAMIGNIANFEHASQLKSYVGWVPKVAQSGSSLDWTRLSPRGVRQMKQTMYLIVWRAIQWDAEWKAMYERLSAYHDSLAWEGASATQEGYGQVWRELIAFVLAFGPLGFARGS